MEHCTECGYDYDDLDRSAIAPTIRAVAPQFGARLASSTDQLRSHPVAGSWSALEYSCHVRDVLRTQHERIDIALLEVDPVFVSMRREERVLEEHYNDQTPSVVADEIRDAAEGLAVQFERLDEREWARTGVYNYPTTASRTVEWIGRHTIHEARHHLSDVDRLLAAAA